MAGKGTSLNYHFEVLRTELNQNGKWNTKRRSFNNYEQARKFVSNDVDYSPLNVILMDVDYWYFFTSDDLVKTIQIRLIKNGDIA